MRDVDYARIKYSAPPTKAQLAARIAKGEVLQGSNAVLACELGLGTITRTLHSTLVLVPTGAHPPKTRPSNE